MCRFRVFKGIFAQEPDKNYPFSQLRYTVVYSIEDFVLEAVPYILEFLADMLKQGSFIHAQNAFDILKQEGSRMQDTENALVFHEEICPRIHLSFTER